MYRGLFWRKSMSNSLFIFVSIDKAFSLLKFLKNVSSISARIWWGYAIICWKRLPACFKNLHSKSWLLSGLRHRRLASAKTEVCGYLNPDLSEEFQSVGLVFVLFFFFLVFASVWEKRRIKEYLIKWSHLRSGAKKKTGFQSSRLAQY